MRRVLRGQSASAGSDRTIGNQLASIHRKLGTSGRAELAHKITKRDCGQQGPGERTPERPLMPRTA
jgi:hypothetical protein